MEIRWSPEAADDFANVIRRIREDSPTAALRVARMIYQGIAQLKNFPDLGRHGRLAGTRELLFPPPSIHRSVSLKREYSGNCKGLAWGAEVAMNRRAS